MNDKLKLPLTAVFSFLLGGVVFFPWGSNRDSGFIIDSANMQSIPATTVTRKKKILVKKVDYHFSGYDIALSNSAIKSQLKNSIIAKKESEEELNAIITNENQPATNPGNVLSIIVVEYNFSKEELKKSNLAIENQLKKLNDFVELKPDTEIKIVEQEIIKENKVVNVKPIIIVEYRFSSVELKKSNLAIKEQLRKLGTITNQTKERILVRKAEYHFDTEALALSKIAIDKQLGRNVAENNELNSNHKTNIDEVEVAEKSEINLFVSDVSEYSNETDSTELNEIENTEKKYENIEFSESELALSNLAIAKQLKGYKDKTLSDDVDFTEALSNVDDAIESVSAKVKIENNEDDIDESKLLLSNSGHEEVDDDEEEYSTIPVKFKSTQQFRKNELSSLNENETHSDSAKELEEDDDDDDFSGERVFFNNEPRFLTNHASEVFAKTIDDKIEIPDVEDIQGAQTVEEIEVIEEIDISDDGKIITSSENKL
ncbi:MAG: hypothetical protein ACC653_05010 [Gammaproteobacteria bacterium]